MLELSLLFLVKLILQLFLFLTKRAFVRRCVRVYVFRKDLFIYYSLEVSLPKGSTKYNV